jgi:hypothetical protein
MISKQQLLLAIFTLVQCYGIAQGLYGKTWVISEPNVTLSFNKQSNNTYQYVLNSTLTFPPYATYKGCGSSQSSICDSATGALQFYTNGQYIYNANAMAIDNSDSLITPYAYSRYYYLSSNQGTLILPKGNKKYDVFFPYFSDGILDSTNYMDLFLHHTIDMNANGGAGTVVKKQEDLLHGAGRLSALNMDAVRHANGIDWWILKLGYGQSGFGDSLYFYTWLVKQDTIEGPTIYYAGDKGKDIYDCGFGFIRAQMKFSIDGSKFAGTHGCRNFYYADFNRCSGKISNMVFAEYPIDTSWVIPGDTTLYYDSIMILASTSGIAFSPNNKYIYLSCGYRIWQYEPKEMDSTKAWFMAVRMWDTMDAYIKGSMQYAPDSTLLIFADGGSAPNGYINGIVHPDKKGKDCLFKSNVVSFAPGQPWPYFTNNPNHPNWALGADESLCWPVGNLQLSIINEQFTMHPNPANTQVLIDVGIAKKQQLQITNTNGQVVHQQELRNAQTSIDVSRWVSGVYFVRVGNVVKKLLVE